MPWIIASVFLLFGGAWLDAAGGDRPVPASHARQTACPPDAEGVQMSVRSYLAKPDLLRNRGYAPVSPDSLRLMTDSRDSAVCATLKQRFTATPRPGTTTYPRYVYYRAGPYYFSALYQVTGTGQRAFGPGHLLVIDSQLRVIDSVLM